MFSTKKRPSSSDDSFVETEPFPSDRVKGHSFFGHILTKEGGCKECEGTITNVNVQGNHLSFIDEHQQEVFGFDEGNAAWGEEDDDIVIIVPLQAEITVYDISLLP